MANCFFNLSDRNFIHLKINTMTQEIIVYIILAIAILYIIYINIKKKTSKKAGSCGNCTGCELKNKLQKTSCSTNSYIAK